MAERNSGDVIFGNLTAEEVVAGLNAEASHIAATGYMQKLVDAEPGTGETGEAIAGLLHAQSQGDLQAGIKLTLARLEVAEAIAGSR